MDFAKDGNFTTAQKPANNFNQIFNVASAFIIDAATLQVRETKRSYHEHMEHSAQPQKPMEAALNTAGHQGAMTLIYSSPFLAVSFLTAMATRDPLLAAAALTASTQAAHWLTCFTEAKDNSEYGQGEPIFPRAAAALQPKQP